VVYNEREHVLVGLWIMGDEEVHSVRQVTERVCRDVLLDSTQNARRSDVVIGDYPDLWVIKVNEPLRVNV
jgi:hypothetical protein